MGRKKEKFYTEKSIAADDRSDKYVLMTVIFATIFLLAGIAPKIRIKSYMIYITLFASLIFLITAAFLLTFPKIIEF